MKENSTSVDAKVSQHFQVHFDLAEKSHSMDALVLHNCEGELFALLKEVGRQLGVEFNIEATAYVEGGLSVHLNFLGKHAVALGLIGSAVVGICSAGVWMRYQSVLLQQQINQNDFALNRDRRLAEQQFEQNDLALKKARLELKSLEQDSSDDAPKAPSTTATRPLPLEPPPTATDVVPALLSNPRVQKLRSQFYQHLLGCEKVSAVGFASNHERSPADEVKVPRTSFSTYVVTPQELEPTVIQDAEIEVVSPVLRRDSFKWKGVFEKHGISFEVDDEEFLANVAARKVHFQSGTTLVCDLEIHVREAANGRPEAHAFVVTRVSKHFNKQAPTESSKTTSIVTVSQPHPPTFSEPARAKQSMTQLLLLRNDGQNE